MQVININSISQKQNQGKDQKVKFRHAQMLLATATAFFNGINYLKIYMNLKTTQSCVQSMEAEPRNFLDFLYIPPLTYGEF